jgi:phosphatidylglycerol---prolipoprotein diacylglyceryl transferase
MLPYFELHSFQIGFVTIQVWGLLVALGILTAAFVSSRLAKARGQKTELIWDMTAWVIAGAFLFARLFVVLFYEPGFYFSDPLAIFKIWEGGWSIMGGFLGGTLAAILFLRYKRVDVYAYADTIMFGIPVGLFIGRIGCFLIHDHPGTVTNFFLGVEYPDGIVRHDHGLYLSLNGLFLFLVFLYLAKKKVRTGTFLVVGLIWYGAVRFGLDFLRATDGVIVDSRYFGLTTAQYFSLGMIVLGVYLAKKRKLV